MLDEALRLSAAERTTLAGGLIESLDEEVDPDAEAAWSAEDPRAPGAGSDHASGWLSGTCYRDCRAPMGPGHRGPNQKGPHEDAVQGVIPRRTATKPAHGLQPPDPAPPQ